MSAFIAAVGEHSAILISDGASYNYDGVVVSIGPKVTIGKVAPIAVTTRGSHLIGQKVQQAICETADRYGVDYALDSFAREFPTLKAADGAWIHVHIIAWSLTCGPIQLSAHNCPQAFSDGQEPLTVTSPGGHYIAGTPVDEAGLAASGMRARRDGEDLADYLATEGPKVMEAMRQAPARPVAGDGWSGDQYLVGGQCDVSVVSMWGATTKTVRTWPDVVGEKIIPASMLRAAA
ncbi:MULTISPECIES: hypothetical protein [unclassified Mesorhizobium]|uniref:hypothetical protein n=1 Tax=unclassified Mesorhizobium TaxID=325217 RepID=UPI001129F747|nr:MULTISPECIES: hypothetical protein [unclassified Mesorhizobium]MCA0000920.1 hypothetical protein [Mesorhizobium sp. B264B2A]MCA0004669.1 hypothetical protein [Mesorhizobium sp. B264B1B]MCA0019132.1 hypothetical protein [Mesorhizobium sp. B264B1A]TPJ44612.1 hypothetical protein FJ437_19305 [Mesorhizobium sp. B2-6-6]